MNKYKLKHFDEVFTPEFLSFLLQKHPEEMSKNHLRLIMEKVEQHEIKYGLEFVNFYSNNYIIFKSINENG